MHLHGVWRKLAQGVACEDWMCFFQEASQRTEHKLTSSPPPALDTHLARALGCIHLLNLQLIPRPHLPLSSPPLHPPRHQSHHLRIHNALSSPSPVAPRSCAPLHAHDPPQLCHTPTAPPEPLLPPPNINRKYTRFRKFLGGTWPEITSTPHEARIDGTMAAKFKRYFRRFWVSGVRYLQGGSSVMLEGW